MKITAIVSLILIGMLYAAGMTCDACGKECASTCGTRRFRACCFNYLRKKRDPSVTKFWKSEISDNNEGNLPVLVMELFPRDLENLLAVPSTDDVDDYVLDKYVN